MRIIAALFIDSIDLRQVDGPSTRIDLTGVKFSEAASGPAPVTVAPHLVVLVYCPAGDPTSAVLETRFTPDGGDEVLARNVQPLQVDEGKFNYRLVRAELELADYGAIEARCSIDGGAETVVPFSVLPPVA